MKVNFKLSFTYEGSAFQAAVLSKQQQQMHFKERL